MDEDSIGEKLKHLAAGSDRMSVSPAELVEGFPELVGRVFLRWGGVEEGLARLLAAMLDQPDRVGDVLYYSSSNFKARLDLVRSVHSHVMRRGEEWEKIKQLLNRLGHLSAFRNRIAHTYVVLGQENAGWQIQFSMKKPATANIYSNATVKGVTFKTISTQLVKSSMICIFYTEIRVTLGIPKLRVHQQRPTK